MVSWIDKAKAAYEEYTAKQHTKFEAIKKQNLELLRHKIKLTLDIDAEIVGDFVEAEGYRFDFSYTSGKDGFVLWVNCPYCGEKVRTATFNSLHELGMVVSHINAYIDYGTHNNKHCILMEAHNGGYADENPANKDKRHWLIRPW